MIDTTMIVRLLPAHLIVNGFVKGEPDCNYELYLTEIVNSSEYFVSKYGTFTYNSSSQSHGECDAFTENYNLDYKLIAGKSVLQARSELSAGIVKTCEGGVLFTGSKSKIGEQKYSRIFAGFRYTTLSDLEIIRCNPHPKNFIESDMKGILEILETDKNLLLFFPFVFSFSEAYDETSSIEKIVYALNHDFSSAFDYRKKVITNKDTYFVCLFNDSFLFMELKNTKLHFIECVPTKSSRVYTKLQDYDAWA